jgi:gliotoxin/aspirochlorine biosynthesis thioredoxin reductase
MALHLAENAAQLTGSANIYTNGSDEVTKDLISRVYKPFNIESRKIRRLSESDTGILVEFTDGSSQMEAFIVHNPTSSVQGPFVQQLGIELTQTGDIKADAPFHQTSVRGVFAAGDAITPYKVIPGAISSGCNAAVAASSQILAEKYGHHSMF